MGDSKREQVRRHILGELGTGKYPVGTRFVSENCLVRETGICKNTVREAVSSLVSAGVLVRRQGSGTYVVRLGEAPEVARRRVIGVYSSDPIETMIESRLIGNGIRAAAFEAGCDVLHFGGDCAASVAELRRNPGIDLAGVVLTHLLGSDSAELGRRFPELKFVIANYQTADFERLPENIHGVFAEEFAGGYLMASHLIGKGCRRIGVHSAGHSGDTNYSQRIAGYRYALEENGIAFDPALIYECDSTGLSASKREAGRSVMARMLADGAPDAYFGLNDFFTAGACDYLKEHAPPRPMVMAGYDNYDPELGQYYNFSTVAVDLEGIGRHSVQLLIRKDFPGRRILLPPRLVAR